MYVARAVDTSGSPVIATAAETKCVDALVVYGATKKLARRFTATERAF
jgi:hypothetical protein